MIYSVSRNNSDKKANETHIFAHPLDRKGGENEPGQIKTLHDSYRKRISRPQEEFLGRRLKLPDGSFELKYSWMTNEEVFGMAEKIGKALVHLELCPQQKSWKNMQLRFVGFYSTNTVRFMIADIGACMYGITNIPIYDTLGEEATEFAFE